MGFFSDLFNALFGKKKKPTRPPVQQFHAVAVTVFSQDGKVVPHARVVLDNFDKDFEGTTDDDGYSLFPNVPVSLVSSHLTVEADGFMPFSAHVDLPAVNMTIRLGEPKRIPEDVEFPALTPVFTGRAITGQLRLNGDVWTDDAGPLVPCFCHFGEAFSAFTRRPDAVRSELAEIRKAGYQGIRFWDHLGYYSYWRGREVSPWSYTGHDGVTVTATPDYYEKLEAFLLACRDVGLKVHHSRGDLNAVSLADIHTHMERVAQIYDRIGCDVCALMEANNEDWQNGNLGPARMSEVTAPFRHRGILTASSCPEGATEERDALIEWRKGVDVSIVHGYRGGRWYDKVRHPFSISYEGKVYRVWQGEPTGPGSDVSATERREELEVPGDGDARLAAMALAAGLSGQAWVYMSGFGVRWNGPIASQVGFQKVADSLALLPADVGTYRTYVHGGTTWKGRRVFAAPGDVRCDHAIHDDGRFVCLIYGPEDVRGLTPERECVIEHDVVLSREIRLVIGRIL
jgi:hypothetical protein